MMNYKFKILIVVFGAIVSSLCQAQPEKILEVSVFPSNPTVLDSVYAILESRSNNSSTSLGYTSMLENDSFYFAHCIVHGPMTIPRYYRDTFNLGLLTTGTYVLKFTTYTSYTPDSCSYLNPIDSTITFEVTKNTSVPGLKKQVIQVYPNPASETIHTSLTQPTEVHVYDALGRRQKGVAVFDKHHPIDIREWRKGIYLLHFPAWDQTQRIVVQ